MLTAEKLIEIMNQVLKLDLDPAATPRNVEFKSLGIDSLDFFGVLVELESVVGQKIPDEAVEKLNTIDNIVNYFSDRSA